MTEEINKIGLHELLKKSKITDTDILIVQDKENTKQVSFKDLRSSLITDEELPAKHRMYSSYKVNEIFEDVRTQVTRGIGTVEGRIEYITTNYPSNKQLNEKLQEFANKVPELADIESIKKSLESKRDKSVSITCNDIESGEDASKIQPKNLSKAVIDMMTGNATINTANAPDGGWVMEDIANGAINGNKLSKQYRYRGHYPEGNINNFTRDGLYLLGSSVTGLPKYDPQETGQNRLLEVCNYSPDENIIQRVYYTEDDEFIRPVYERKAPLSRLHVTDFYAKYDITDKFKITNNVLHDNFLNAETVSTGSVYDLKLDRDYLVKKTVKDLPNDKYDFTVSVRKYDTRTEYIAKAINYNSCEIYVSNEYQTSIGLTERTPWWQTNTVSKSKFQGQKLHLFGDGICFGMGSTDITTLSFPVLLNSKYGITIQNHALGDATIGVYGDEYFGERSVITQIESARFADNDLVIIFAGSNDYKSGVAKIGNNKDVNNYSFKGALNTCIQRIMTMNSTVRILIISPLFRARLDADDFRNSDDTLINEMALSDYTNAMKEVCEYNHIPFLDLHATSMINKYNFPTYLKDRLYPNDKGHALLADKIFNALNYYY